MDAESTAFAEPFDSDESDEDELVDDLDPEAPESAPAIPAVPKTTATSPTTAPTRTATSRASNEVGTIAIPGVLLVNRTWPADRDAHRLMLVRLPLAPAASSFRLRPQLCGGIAFCRRPAVRPK